GFHDRLPETSRRLSVMHMRLDALRSTIEHPPYANVLPDLSPTSLDPASMPSCAATGGFLGFAGQKPSSRSHTSGTPLPLIALRSRGICQPGRLDLYLDRLRDGSERQAWYLLQQ